MCGKRLYAWKTIPILRLIRLTSTPRRGDLLALDDDAAGVDRLEQVHAAQERRLAGAGRADQADDLVLGDGEVDAAKHLVLAERLAHALEDERVAHAVTPPPAAGAGRARSASR